MPIASFGDVLRDFRMRKHISQRTLAEKMGVHRNTIWSWEQGNYLPDSKSMVLELANQLGLNEAEIRQLLEASLTALSPHWSVPYQRNAFFTGREALIEMLHQRLRADQAGALSQAYALHGLGGIGKTQIALEYACRYALEYSAVFWIEAETIESVLASLGRIAASLQLPERDETDQQRMVAAVQHWLTTNGTWLLIWDNVEDPALLQRFLPPVRQGATLITTRRQALGTLAQSIELPPMTLEEGTQFVLRRAQFLKEDPTEEQLSHDAKPLPHEWEAAQALVRMMGGLPLALDQAGAYIEETGCNVSAYLQRYEQQRTLLLDRRGTAGRDHPQAVTTTFALAYAQVRQQNPLAADLLCLCAFLSAEGIPEELFLTDATHPAEDDDSCTANPLVMDLYQLDQAIAALRNFSLVQRQPEAHTLSLHRLVQIILQDEMDTQERTAFQQRVVSLLHALLPEVTHDNWKQWERLLPHVLLCETAISDHTGGLELAEVLRKSAEYLRERAQYEQAEPLFQRALRIQKQALGPDHPQVARSLYGLAFMHSRQGKYTQAEPLFQQALHIQKQALGPDDPQVAQSLYGLAFLSNEQGKYAQAEPLFQQALRIWEQVLGPDHLQVAYPLNGLTVVYRMQTKYAQAEALCQRALDIREHLLGSEHPDVAASLYNLADIYREQGKYEQAEVLYQRSLRIWEQTIGPEHPQLANSLNGLAVISCEQKKYEQAEALYQRALHIWEHALGSEHSLVAYALNNLGELYMEQAKYALVEPLYQRSLSILKQTRGPEHPEVAYLLNGLATLYREMGRYEEAESLFQQALTIREQQLSQHHPDRARSLAGLAKLYEKRGQYEQAEPLLQEACLIFEHSLGQAHPETVKAQNDYRCLLEQRADNACTPVVEHAETPQEAT